MPAPIAGPSLSCFLRTRAEDILRTWDEFASTVPNAGSAMDAPALRDHAAEILKTIAADMELRQTDAQQRGKSRGDGERLGWWDTAAETHADTRMSAGFAILPMMTEYRALRASVLRLWVDAQPPAASDAVAQITRFNEAVDQALIESAARYTERTKHSTDLFIGVLGHDIRNPLGTIANAIHILERTGRLERAAAQPILNSVARIKGVIEQIVDFTRAQAGTPMPVKRSPGDLAAQARDIVAEMRILHPEVEIALECGDCNFEGCWDTGRLGQLLSNLLGNAVQYGDGSRVTVSLQASDAEVVLAVRNGGPPIPQEECARIFEPLVRGSGGQVSERTGLGLGLYVCREVVRAHGGQIEVRSDAAEGTRFMVYLPRSAEDAT